MELVDLKEIEDHLVYLAHPDDVYGYGYKWLIICHCFIHDHACTQNPPSVGTKGDSGTSSCSRLKGQKGDQGDTGFPGPRFFLGLQVPPVFLEHLGHMDKKEKLVLTHTVMV